MYLAREVSLDRPVALKVLQSDQGLEARERFLQEARTAARLSHPHIVPILTVEECGTFVFFTMPYIGGGTVGERVRTRGPFLPPDAVRVLRDVAWALAYSHGQNVIHRDIKPDNILLERETQRTLVADFGIAAAAGVGQLGHGVVGTPAFMSPEQIRAEAIDARSDIYSLAAVAYYMLAGQLPFEAPTAEAQLLAHLNQPPRPLRSLVPQVPSALAELVMRGLDKDASKRPPSAEAFAAALSHWLGGEHRPVPAGVNRFLTQLRESRPVALLYSTVVALLLFIQLVLAILEPWRLPSILTLGFLFGVPPLIVVLARVRSLVVLGHDQADLVEVLQAAAEREAQEARQVQATGLRWKRIALRWCAIVALVSGVIWLPGPVAYKGLLFIVNLVSVACVVVLSDQVHDGSRERLRVRLWGGPVGRWLFRIAALGVRRRIPGLATEHRTEVALGLSVRALFDRLPPATRRELPEFPGIVEGLEAEAVRTRRRRIGLRQLQGTADDPQFTARLSSAEQSLARRHAEVVTALEGIRLSLLRLHVGSATVEGLTTDLGRASDLASRLGHLADAHDEVDRLSA